MLIHDQAFFGADALTLNAAQLSLIKLSIPNPTNPQISSWEKEEGSQDLLSTARTKLAKRTTPQKLEDAVADATRYHLQGAALMSALRSQAPELHDNLSTVIASRRRHLEFVGPTAVTASGILNDEIMNLKEAIKGAAPNLSPENVDQLVFGTVSEWIMQCPLDFPNVP